MNKKLIISILALFPLCSIYATGYTEASPTLIIHNLWLIISTALIFIMHLGFATLESGLARSKNSINILFKNVMTLAIGFLSYFYIGFSLMYPNFSDAIISNVLGFDGFGLHPPMVDGKLDLSYSDSYTYWTYFIFQAMFAATTATIISGAVAERVKLSSFLIFSIILVSIIYPIIGSWAWGGGFLQKIGFYDLAGSTIIHSVGGWAALVFIYFLGARIDKFNPDGSVNVLSPHSLPLATVGFFLLCFGWIGFNGGSVLSAEPVAISYVILTTFLSVSSGIIFSILASKVVFKSFDLSAVLAGALGSLVGITAGADTVSLIAATIIGATSGVLVILSLKLLDKVKLDDPVGAIPVHLVCGIWGTLSVGIFSKEHSILTQLAGIGIIGIFTLTTSTLVLLVLKKVLGLRVNREEELKGLDIVEHNASAYGDFQVLNK